MILSRTDMNTFISSRTDMNEFISSRTDLDELISSRTDLDELISSKTDLDELIEFMMSRLNSSRKFLLRHERINHLFPNVSIFSLNVISNI